MLPPYHLQHPQYKALKAKLAEARGQKTEDIEIVCVPEGPSLKPGMNDPRVGVLRKRLNIAGDQSNTAYDATVTEAVKAFQKGAGLNTDGLYTKDVDAVLNEGIDLVVTVCDNAKESCPVFPRPIPSIHLPFHDPHGEPLDSFIAVRDDIRKRLVAAVRDQFGL